LEIVGCSAKVLFPCMMADFITALAMASGLSFDGQFLKLWSGCPQPKQS
jgi:hypothetical protein